MAQEGSLYNGMGGNSPMFLTPMTSQGLDTSPLGYFVQQRERAQQHLAKKIADQTPTLPEFDDKNDFLPGEQQELKNRVLQKRNDLSKIMKRYGDSPPAYNNSPEWAQAIGGFNHDIEDLQTAKMNKKEHEQAEVKVSEKDLGAQTHLDENNLPTGYNEKGQRFDNESDYLSKERNNVEYEDAGNGQQRLKTKRYQIINATGLDEEVGKLAGRAGHTDWTTESQNVKWDPKTKTYVGGGTLADDYSYNVIQNSKNQYNSNNKQLNSAINTLNNHLSEGSKRQLWTELWDGHGEKFDMNKAYKDPSYRDEVFKKYMFDRIVGAVSPYKDVHGVDASSMQILGKSSSGEGQSKDVQNLLGNIVKGTQMPDENTTDDDSYVLGPGTIPILNRSATKQVWSGPGIKNELDERFNNNNAKNPMDLSSFKGVIWGGKVNDLTQENHRDMKNATIKQIKAVTTGAPMIYDANIGAMRSQTTTETTMYNNIIKWRDPILPNGTANPDYSPAKYQAMEGKLGVITSGFKGSNQEWIDAHTPKYYYIADISIPSNTDMMKKFKFYKKNGLSAPEATSAVTETFGINSVQDNAKVELSEDGTHYILKDALLEMKPNDVILGTDKQTQSKLNEAPRLKQAEQDQYDQANQQQGDAVMDVFSNMPNHK